MIELAPGTLNVTGGYTQESAGSFLASIGGTTAGSQFGQLNVTGQANLNGALEVSLFGGFTPALSDSFPIMTFGSQSGRFATETGLSIGGGLNFTALIGPSSLDLVLSAPVSYTVTTTANSGGGSLRDAIEAADASAGGFTINFNIPTTDPGFATASVAYGTINYWTIAPASPLPAITTSTTINGFSQLGFSNYLPGIVISGAQAGLGSDGLDLTGNGVRVLALTIDGFSGAGIKIESNGDVIQDCNVGTDSSVLHAAGNGVGIQITGASSLIGTDGHGGSAQDLLERDVISGNAGSGIWLEGAGATENVLGGNLIGTDITGTAALPNGQAGVLLSDGASNNSIGGTSSGAGNLISGNATGVDLSDSSANVVQGNLIGLDQSGSLALGNTGAGVLVEAGSASNTIGGAVGGARNVISGNAAGVSVTGAATTGTLIAGNLIGTDLKGAVAVGNRMAGIDLAGGTAATIGGKTKLASNLISGNDGDGLDVGSGVTNTLIQANYVGIDQTGVKPLGNKGDGVSIDAAPGTTLGGVVQGAGNVISGNALAGLLIDGVASPAALVVGNRIGTDYTATTAIGNGTFGIMESGATGVTIGGTVSGSQNIISGNVGAGIGLSGGTTGTVVQGNLIGTDDTGANPLGNGTGVLIGGDSANNTIGGTASGAGNTVAFSAGIGVDVAATAGTGNAIRLNAIFSNTALGIDLGGDGVTLNNSAGHFGPNDFQNFPVITAVSSAAGTTTVSGTLSSTPSETFALDFYTLSSINRSGYGEGRYVLGSSSISTDNSGNASFSFSYPNTTAGSQFVTATATDSNGNTSEFSHEFGIDHPPTARIGFTTLTVGEGAPIKFDGTTSSSPDGDSLLYTWAFGDGATATGPAPSHTYTAVGTDQVTLTVSDGLGGLSTATATITVVDVPPQFTRNAFLPPQTYNTTAPGDDFGESVAAVDGNVAIGAPNANGPAVSDTGAVYLHDGVPTDNGVSTTYVYGSLMHVFADPHPATGDLFGASLAVVGNELVIGAPGSSSSGARNGVVYVFDADYDSATFGSLLATLSIPDSDAQANAQFGASVGTTDTNILVGAPGKDGGRGEVYEYEGDTTQATFGDLMLKVASPSPVPLAHFGAAVAGLGDNVIATAPLASTPDADAFGMVYLLDGATGSVLSSIANPNNSSGFGSSVASVGANIVIGSPLDGSAGTAFLYSPSGGLLTTFIQPDSGGGGFGAAVAGTGNTALIGAPAPRSAPATPVRPISSTPIRPVRRSGKRSPPRESRFPKLAVFSEQRWASTPEA